MKKIIIILMAVLFSSSLFAQDQSIYEIDTNDGKYMVDLDDAEILRIDTRAQYLEIDKPLWWPTDAPYYDNGQIFMSADSSTKDTDEYLVSLLTRDPLDFVVKVMMEKSQRLGWNPKQDRVAGEILLIQDVELNETTTIRGAKDNRTLLIGMRNNEFGEGVSITIRVGSKIPQ